MSYPTMSIMTNDAPKSETKLLTPFPNDFMQIYTKSQLKNDLLVNL